WTTPALTWDDGSNIFNNPYYTMHRWWGVWSDAYYGLYVPVTMSAWAFLFWIGEGQTWPFRLFNILIHSANIALLYFVLKGLARKWKLHSPIAVTLAVGVFALHPLQVETVAWISGGRDLLATFFALAAVALYYSYPKRLGYFAATLLFVCALLSKPSVVILPAAIMATDMFLLGSSFKSSLKKMTLWFFLALFAIYLTQLAQVEHFVNQVEWWQRPVVILHNYGFYLQKLIWPYPLSGNYALTPEVVVATGAGRAFAALLILVVGFLLAKKYDRRYFVGALALILLLPVSGIVPFGYEKISGVADHYAYLPMAAVAALLMLSWNLLARRKGLLAIPFILIGAWSWASFERTKVWQSDQSFFTDMSLTAPNSYSTAMGMSVVMCEDLKDYDAGLKWLDVALKAQPDDVLALANRAFCLLNAGRNKETMAMDSYLNNMDHEFLAANQPTAYSSLISSVGTAMIKEEEYEMGFQYLCEAYRILPSEANHVNNLQAAAEILRQHGFEPSCEENQEDQLQDDE
ncbi:MAG: hypothetical protein ACXVA9_06785, partial [Bdellovibrionales bacterium]